MIRPEDTARRDAIHAAWRADRATKLASLHPLIAAEVESMAWERHRQDQPANILPLDLRIAEARVVSRRRVKAYGAQPEDYDEAKRQTNEIRANLGLGPLP